MALRNPFPAEGPRDTPSKEFRFEYCQAITPAGRVIAIPEGTFLIVESDIVSIAVRGRIVDITPASFALLRLDGKAMPV